MKQVFIDTDAFIEDIARREIFFEASALASQLCKLFSQKKGCRCDYYT